MSSPSTDGRDGKGRFAPGNKANPTGSKGNSHVQALRMALQQAVSAADVKAIADKLIKMAKGGDVDAACTLFDRLWGRPSAKVDLEVSGGLDLMSDAEMIDAAVKFGRVDLLPARLRERMNKENADA